MGLLGLGIGWRYAAKSLSIKPFIDQVFFTAKLLAATLGPTFELSQTPDPDTLAQNLISRITISCSSVRSEDALDFRRLNGDRSKPDHRFKVLYKNFGTGARCLWRLPRTAPEDG